MILLLVLLGIASSVLLAGMYSGAETAAYGASTVRLRLRAAAGDHLAGVALRMLGRMPELITTTLIGHNVSVYLATYLMTAHYEMAGFQNAEVVATFTLLPFMFIFAETLPKRAAHTICNHFVVETTRILWYSRWLFRPLGLLLGSVSHLLRNVLDYFGIDSPDPSGRARLQERLEACRAEGILTEAQHRIAEKILEIEEKTVREAMMPASKAFRVPEQATCREAVAMMHDAGYNRALLVDKAENYTGRMATLNTILRNPGAPEQPVVNLAMDAVTLEVNLSVAKALLKMRESHARVAIVVNRNGNPVGVVTLSRLLSNIVGGLKL